MDQTVIFRPFFATMLLTMVVWIYMYGRRLPFIFSSGLDPKHWSQVPLYEGQGCIECAGTGFKGRTAIHELLDLTDRIREMILAKKPTSEIRRAAREEGMRFLRESALDKVRSGVTTLKEINKVTFIETFR